MPTIDEAFAAHGSERRFAAGEHIMREGEPAEHLYVIRSGTVALETTVPGRGPVTLQTLHDGDLLGWSWMVPPHRTRFDARAVSETVALAVDGERLRAACDADPALGYAVLRRLAVIFTERLTETRLRLLDLYATAGDG